MGIDDRALIVRPLDIAAINLNGGPIGELDLGIDGIGPDDCLQMIGRPRLNVAEGATVGHFLAIDAALRHGLVKRDGCSVIVAEDRFGNGE